MKRRSTRRLTARSASVVALAALATLAAPVRAQDRDPASAEALFVKGRTALAAGKLDEACTALGESFRLDAAAGTLLNLADCEEKRGHSATAWEHFRHAAEMLSPTDERLAQAKARADKLESRLPKLEIRVAEPRPAGVAVKRDGKDLGPGAQGVALPVDPGPHTVTASWVGGHTETKVVVREGESRTLLLALTEAPPPQRIVTPARSERRAGLVRQHSPWPWVLTAAAGSALGVSAATGMAALGRDQTMNAHCNDARECDAVGVEAGQAGRRYATASTVSFAVGGVLAVAAAYLFIRDAARPLTATETVPRQPSDTLT